MTGQPSHGVDIYVVKQGMGMTEATVAEWCVEVGTHVSEGDIVAVIMTDKVNLEVPSPASGVLAAIFVQSDEDFAVPGVIGRIDVTRVTA